MSETDELNECCAKICGLCCGFYTDEKYCCCCCCILETENDPTESYCCMFCGLYYQEDKEYSPTARRITHGYCCNLLKLINHEILNKNDKDYDSVKNETVICRCINILNGDVQLYNDTYTSCLLTCCCYNICYNKPYTKKDGEIVLTIKLPPNNEP